MIYLFILFNVKYREYLIIKLNNFIIRYMIESNELKLENLRKAQELKV